MQSSQPTLSLLEQIHQLLPSEETKETGAERYDKALSFLKALEPIVLKKTYLSAAQRGDVVVCALLQFLKVENDDALTTLTTKYLAELGKIQKIVDELKKPALTARVKQVIDAAKEKLQPFTQDQTVISAVRADDEEKQIISGAKISQQAQAVLNHLEQLFTLEPDEVEKFITQLKEHIKTLKMTPFRSALEETLRAVYFYKPRNTECPLSLYAPEPENIFITNEGDLFDKLQLKNHVVINGFKNPLRHMQLFSLKDQRRLVALFPQLKTHIQSQENFDQGIRRRDASIDRATESNWFRDFLVNIFSFVGSLGFYGGNRITPPITITLGGRLPSAGLAVFASSAEGNVPNIYATANHEAFMHIVESSNHIAPVDSTPPTSRFYVENASLLLFAQRRQERAPTLAACSSASLSMEREGARSRK